jgi:hypothetical protein
LTLDTFRTTGKLLYTLADVQRIFSAGEIAKGHVTLPRQTGPDVKFEHHLEEGHDEEDAEAVHG